MSTVDKALSVLDLFSESEPNLGLSEIARKLGWDKSNVRRYVSDLAGRGILEQNARDKTYCLGPALTRLAMVRDRTHPIARQSLGILEDLVAATGETAHISTFVAGKLMTTAVVETTFKGTRVYIDPAEPLPFHATGSGIAFLSHSDEARVAKVLARDLEAFTAQTPLAEAEILARLRAARESGYALVAGSYEIDVVGVAAPILGFDGLAVGAVAVATPTARFGDQVKETIIANVLSAAGRLSKLHGAA